jgi:hypothetical protein
VIPRAATEILRQEEQPQRAPAITDPAVSRIGTRGLAAGY